MFGFFLQKLAVISVYSSHGDHFMIVSYQVSTVTQSCTVVPYSQYMWSLLAAHVLLTWWGGGGEAMDRKVCFK